MHRKLLLSVTFNETVVLTFSYSSYMFLTMFRGGPRTAMGRNQGQPEKMYLKTSIKSKIWYRIIKVTTLQILRAATVPS